MHFPGNLWFNECSKITSVVIPDNVTSIGAYAFSDCSALTSVTIGSGVTSIADHAFDSCSKLSAVDIPDSVTSIGAYAFTGCSKLAGVTIGSGVETIGECAFYKSYVTAFTVSAGNTAYASDEDGVLFNKDKTTLVMYPIGSTTETYRIPSGVVSVSDRAFSECGDLTSVVLSDTVTSIGVHAFSYCDNLTTVSIRGPVTDFGASAFSHCTKLSSLYLKCLRVIGDYAFDYCAKLKTVGMPDTVTYIGIYAFEECTSLSKLTIGGGVTAIGDCAFTGCTALTSVTIPDSVTSIGNSAFSSCNGITDMTIGYGVKSIGEGAFLYCTSLATLTLGSSSMSIGSDAFALGRSDSAATCDVYCVQEGVLDAYGNAYTTFVYHDAVTYTLTIKYTGYSSAIEDHVESVACGASYSVQSPSKEGYTPDQATVSGVMPAGNVNVTVTYTVNTYRVSWDVDGEVKEESYTYGAAITKPADPVKEGYTFAGWDPSVPDQMPATDMTFKATWTANQYILTVKYTGYGSAIEDHVESVACGASYSVQSPSKEGYTPDQTVVSGVMPAHDVTVTVTYTVNTYRVSWDVDGEVKEESYTYGAAITKPADPVKEGYTFAGWDPSVPDQMPATDMTFKATWTANQYILTVKYTGYGSAIEDHVESVACGARYSVSSPFKEGYDPDQATVSGVMPAHDVTVTVTYSPSHSQSANNSVAIIVAIEVVAVLALGAVALYRFRS